MLDLTLILFLTPLTFAQSFKGSSSWSQTSIDLKQNNLVDDKKIAFMGKEYNVSFEFLLKELKPPNANLIHMTPGGNLDSYGDRNPAIFVRNTDGLQFASAVNGNKNYVFNTNPILKINEWIKISVTQLLVNGKYMYEVSVNGEVLHTVENTDARIIGRPIRVFASDPWHNAIHGNIRNFKVHTWYNEASLPAGLTTGDTIRIESVDIEKNNELMVMDFIGKEYKISFEVFVNKFGTDPYHSVIHFTIGGNYGQPGDRTPAVWIMNTKAMTIATALSGNINANWNFEGMPEQKWIKVEISQTLVDGKYMFEASVEGQPKISVENTQATRFGPVKVLAGDDWHSPLDGKIRNLVIETKDEK